MPLDVGKKRLSQGFVVSLSTGIFVSTVDAWDIYCDIDPKAVEHLPQARLKMVEVDQPRTRPGNTADIKE